MVKVLYSSLVNTLSGKLHDGVFAKTKGISYLRRHNSSPRKTKSSSQFKIRGSISTLSGLWYSLSSLLKSLWNSYAAATNSGSSGFNQFIRLNNRLYYLFDKSKYISGPPPSPYTPVFPKSVSCICFSAGNFEINWQYPADPDTFIFCNYRPVLPLHKEVSPTWKFGFSSDSSFLYKQLSTGYEESRPVEFRLRSFDLFGRVSPWTHVFSATRFDPGFNWTDLGQQFSQSRIFSFSYLGNGIVLAGTSDNGKILRSVDYGLNWSDLGPQFSQSYIFSLSYLGNGIVLAGTATNGKILRSVDYGLNWSDLGQQFSQSIIYSLSYLGNVIVLAGTGENGKILRSVDYGLNWSDLGQQFSQSRIYSFSYLGNGIVLAGTSENGKILRSVNYGLNWSDLGPQFSQSYILSFSYLGNGIVLAGTADNGKILRSVDYGLNWNDLGQQFSQSQILSLSYLDNGIVLAGTGINGKILRSVC